MKSDNVPTTAGCTLLLVAAVAVAPLHSGVYAGEHENDEGDKTCGCTFFDDGSKITFSNKPDEQ